MSDYICPLCKQFCAKPEYKKADENGFNPGIHCQINRANFGKVSPCFGKNGLCEFCQFFLAVTEERKEGIGGRMRRMIKKELVKRGKTFYLLEFLLWLSA